jgi:hypothetical protein
MNSLTLVNATDLERWADRRDAQQLFPQLVRRLVLATGQRVSRASFRSGEGVQLPGWDGVVTAEENSPFVPAGVSGWELGTGSDSRRKAEEDYRKRKEEPKDLDPRQTTFVFVTPRRWRDKEAWTQERRQDGVWHDVRVYDADDLETWLEQAPAVHLWLSILLGKCPEDVLDLETFWEDLRAATCPPMPTDLLLAGREEVIARIHEWLRAEPASLSLRAESWEEAIAIFAAALHKLSDEERTSAFARTVIVQSEPALRWLAAHQSPLTIVVDFDSSTAVAHAMRQGHRVLVPVGWEFRPAKGCITVPRLSVDAAAKGLTEAGLSDHRARTLAGLARRSFSAFRRKIALRPELHQPTWAQPTEGPALVPAMLAGAWHDTVDDDCKAVARLAGGDYEKVRAAAVRWANASDPPVRRVGGVWYVVSREDAWSLLARYLQADHLQRLEEVILLVLSSPDPCFDLPEGERYMAKVAGKVPRYSAALCRGLAETLAVMATSPETASTTDISHSQVSSPRSYGSCSNAPMQTGACGRPSRSGVCSHFWPRRRRMSSCRPSKTGYAGRIRCSCTCSPRTMAGCSPRRRI